MTGRLAALSALCLLVFLGGSAAWILLAPGRDDPFAACRIPEERGARARVSGRFSLVDGTGRRMSETDAIDRPSLVYLGYTFCPDICPTDMARNAAATDILVASGLDAPRLVFITVDPKRDTPQVVEEFAHAFAPDALGLTGTPEEAAAAMRAHDGYFRLNEDGTEWYLVDHSSFTYLMMPGQGLGARFGSSDSPEEVARRSACVLKAAG